MATRRKTEITIETERIVTIRRRRAMRGFCRQCGCEADMVSMGEVGVLMGTAQLGLVSPDDPGWHVSKDSDGAAVICLPSLLKTIHDAAGCTESARSSPSGAAKES